MRLHQAGWRTRSNHEHCPHRKPPRLRSVIHANADVGSTACTILLPATGTTRVGDSIAEPPFDRGREALRSCNQYSYFGAIVSARIQDIEIWIA